MVSCCCVVPLLRASIRRRRWLRLVICLVAHGALLLLVEPPPPLAAQPRQAQRVAVPAPPPRRAAVIFHGRLGGATWEDHIAQREYRAAPDTTAVAAAYATIQRNVIAANPAWRFDVFFHTWDAAAAEDVARVLNATAWSAGPALLNGHRVTGEAWSSAELALLAMREHRRGGRRGGRPGFQGALCHHGAEDLGACAGAWNSSDFAGAPGDGYDRILVARFDTMFHVPFMLGKLVEDDALYAASWCKATGSLLPPPAPFIMCRFLEHFVYDATGLPDFYFAGSEAVVWSLYASWHADSRVPLFVPLSAPPNHGITKGRVMYKQLKLRRYLWHDIDVGLVRNAHCNVAKFELDRANNFTGVPGVHVTWWERGETDVSDSEQSMCVDGARYYCALTEAEAHQPSGCGAFQWA